MNQVQVTDTMDVEDGVRVQPTPPANEPYVNLYKYQSGEWCAQIWTELDNGQQIADYTSTRSTKSRALQDAFRVAKAEGVPFVQQVVHEQGASVSLTVRGEA